MFILLAERRMWLWQCIRLPMVSSLLLILPLLQNGLLPNSTQSPAFFVQHWRKLMKRSMHLPLFRVPTYVWPDFFLKFVHLELDNISREYFSLRSLETVSDKSFLVGIACHYYEHDEIVVIQSMNVLKFKWIMHKSCVTWTSPVCMWVKRAVPRQIVDVLPVEFKNHLLVYIFCFSMSAFPPLRKLPLFISAPMTGSLVHSGSLLYYSIGGPVE